LNFFDILIGILSIIIGYFLGGILPAFIFGKLQDIDIREEGTNFIERNFWEAKSKLKMLTSKMNIPEYIKETVWKIY